MRRGCLEQQVQNFIDQKRRLVFLRSDFEGISSDYDQVGRAIRKLVKKEKLLKVGYGLILRPKHQGCLAGLYLEQLFRKSVTRA